MWSQLAASIQSGNPYVMVMLVLCFLGMIIIFERLTMIVFVYNINFQKFLSNFKKAVRAEDFDRAIHLCKSSSHTSLPRICRKALEAAERDPSTVRATIEEETIEFLPYLESRLRIIPTLATLVLLTGILSTIDALWQVFTSIAVLDTSEKQSRLAHGIAGALNPTVMGLVISMIFIACHQLLVGFAVKVADKINLGSTVVSNLLVPPEVAYMAAAPMGAGDSEGSSARFESSEPTVKSIESDTTAPAPMKKEEEDFNDAAVEDIKDEEEII
jgi:biopolymer transport protein ExbB/TolQ